MRLVVGDFAADELRAGRLAVVGEVEQVDHSRLLLLHGLPAKVDDALQPEGLVVLLPAVPDQNRVRLGERLELELCRRGAGQARARTVPRCALRTWDRGELLRFQDLGCELLSLRLVLPLDVTAAANPVLSAANGYATGLYCTRAIPVSPGERVG